MLRSSLLASVSCNNVKFFLLMFFVCIFPNNSLSETNDKNQSAINKALFETESGFEKGDKKNLENAFESAVNSAKLMENGISSSVHSPEINDDYSEIMGSFIDPIVSGSKVQKRESDSVNKYGFSDAQMAELRTKTLDAFGIDRGIQGFIFVSRSMQNSLIRSYALQAEKYGFQLIIRGPKKDTVDIIGTMKEWGELFHTTSSLMAIQMDPRLFDSFEVVHVPTFVLTEQGSLSLCDEGKIKQIQYGVKNLPLKTCKPVEKDRYCKISGPISLDWAVDHMSNSGCRIAEEFLDLAGENPTKSNIAISQESWIKAINETFPSKEESRYNKILIEQLTEVHFK